MPTLQLLQDVQTRLERGGRKREEGQIERKELREGGKNMRVCSSDSGVDVRACEISMTRANSSNWRDQQEH